MEGDIARRDHVSCVPLALLHCRGHLAPVSGNRHEIHSPIRRRDLDPGIRRIARHGCGQAKHRPDLH